jgi:hypothetical protein
MVKALATNQFGIVSNTTQQLTPILLLIINKLNE